jgi:glycosyltransferase involved in cell wall biosynthesis
VAFLGTLEPRKNVPALVRGWVSAVRDRPNPPVLVLAGGAGWDTDLDQALAEVPAGLRVLRPGYLPVGELAGLLGGAEVVAYPSLGEGFGLPVLEAMSCGAAVLTTRRLALPEVGGDAVAYTEPDAASIGAALAELLGDADRRKTLAAAAVERAALFSWDACATAHVAAYERAARR